MENNGKGIVPNVPPFYNFNRPPKVPSFNNPPRPSSSVVDAISRKHPFETTICNSAVIIVPSFTDENRLSIQTDDGKKFTVGCNMNSDINGKKLLRGIANRISSHNSREKKKEQIHHLNMTVKRLEDEIIVLQTRGEAEKQKMDELNLEKSMLILSLSRCNDQLEATKARTRELEAELEYYRELSQMQSMPVIERSYSRDTNQTIPETNQELDELETFLSSYNGDTSKTMSETKWRLDEVEAFLLDD